MTDKQLESYKPIPTATLEVLDPYITGIVNHFKSAAELIDEYYRKAEDLGISEQEAKVYLKSKIPKSTFYKALPDQYKDPRKRNRKSSRFGLTRDQTTPEQDTYEFNTQGMGVIVTDEPEDPDPEPIVGQQQQQEDQELGPPEAKGNWNIAPEEYEIEHLEEYGNDLLIEIVKILDSRQGHDALYNKIDELKRENAALKRELEELRPYAEFFQDMDPEWRENLLRISKQTTVVHQQPNTPAAATKGEWLLRK